MTADTEAELPVHAHPPVGDSAAHRTLAGENQTAADSDQGEADREQSAADADQGASERDQRASDSDQATADHDEEVGDTSAAESARFERSRRARQKSTSERGLATRTRSETARIRDDAATRRDRVSADRDATARARDQLAAALDSDVERPELDENSENGHSLDSGPRGGSDRRRAAETRARAAMQRDAAARDREQAAEDRRLAALDREAAAEELSSQGIDSLTGTLRRGTGLDAMRRELDRTARSGQGIVVVFVDVDGLKQVNDTQDHAAGDAMLREVALTIQRHLRSYDMILRFGGDEFVCSITGQDAAGAGERFERVRSDLRDTCDATISLGLAERREGEAVEALIRRADTAMIDSRQRR